ncbi:MAG: helix-turn-helix transcriptional regulator [Oscillospiraceae bacterium]|nr:helix-turn-helix transcriptional regulator [Oscillospiraceae bacterium]
MDSTKIGTLIRALRQKKGLTQKELADQLCVSDKTVSKWERGCGCPDPSLWNMLSSILEVSVETMLQGELNANEQVGGNMKHSKFYVCPVCGNILVCTGNAVIHCCGRILEPLQAKKASENQKLKVEQVEDDWFITTDHPMEKENYLSFVAFATGDKIQLIKQYPEWNLQVRIQKRGHGMLFWYSTTQGFFYQLL